MQVGRGLKILCLTLLALASVGRLSAETQHIDRIFFNGVIWTADEAQPTATAIAIAGDRIVAVGGDAEILSKASSETAKVDLNGRFVTPGFQDSHLHLPGKPVNEIDISRIETLEELQTALKAFADAHPDLPWIQGMGWGYSIFPDQKPHSKYLDAVVSDRPVYLVARDGHMGLANSMAVEMAGVSNETPNPPNGHIQKDEEGKLTGEFKEFAQRLVSQHIPAPSEETIYQTLLVNMDYAASNGLTAVQEAATGLDMIPIFERAMAADAMKVRVRFAFLMTPTTDPYAGSRAIEKPLTEDDIAEYVRLRNIFRGPVLDAGAIKAWLDGTVDAQTASMFEPYHGTNHAGIPFWDIETLKQFASVYDKLGFQMMLHGIGDRAISQALDVFDAVSKENGTTGRRHRIEHVEVPRLEDLKRFKELGVIASTQAPFANPDATVLENFEPLLGPKRAPIADSFSLFDDAGIVQAFGSDYPVFDLNPIDGIAVAVTRQTPEGTPVGGWYPKGRISVEAALRHYTIDGAYASFQEDERGSITVGKLADIVVLSQNLLEIAPEDIRATRVLLTVMGGRNTYRSSDF